MPFTLQAHDEKGRSLYILVFYTGCEYPIDSIESVMTYRHPEEDVGSVGFFIAFTVALKTDPRSEVKKIEI
jgi:hypothetical protein